MRKRGIIMNKLEVSERFSRMFQIARAESGKSQEYVAKSMGVSRKTIQNWEQGLSFPNISQTFEYFSVLELQPSPYFLGVLYPSLNKPAAELDVDKALSDAINSLREEEKLKLLYILAGKHGSSPICILDLITAHLKCPLRDRLNIAESILTNYEIATCRHNILNPHIEPDIPRLKKGIASGKESVFNGKESYTAFEV